jgi:methylated-DNA-[protein]-cysteine S-methyltransferase
MRVTRISQKPWKEMLFSRSATLGRLIRVVNGEARVAFSFATSIGPLGLEASPAGLQRVRLPGERPIEPVPEPVPGQAEATGVATAAATQLGEFLDGSRRAFELELDWTEVGAEHRHALEVLRELAPYGTTVTYGDLGRQAGVADPRDVGVFMSRNPLPLVIPCHRVVATDGLGGYGGGLDLKRRLLELEGALPPRLDLGDV